MKLPNGYGSITKLTGNRRKPWLVRINAGKEYDAKKDDYVPKRVPLGYYRTQKEALAALAEYNKNPFIVSDNDLTFEQAYNIYLESAKYSKLGKSAKTARKCGYAYCKDLYKVRVRDMNKDMVEKVIESVEQGSSTKKSVLTVIRIVVNYAYDRNLINRKCTDGITIEYSEPVVERIPFSQKEFDYLWAHSDEWDIKILLILLYSGLRVNELLKNNRQNINLEEKWIYIPKALAKTKESERYVPIHDRIFELVKYFYDNSIAFDSEKLMINPNGTVITYQNFVVRNLKRINKNLEVEHKFHDTRHTFATRGTAAGIPKLYMQRLMGHTPESILYNTYTHITVEELHNYIKMIK